MPLHEEIRALLKSMQDAHRANMSTSPKANEYHRERWKELKTALDSGELTPYARKVVADEVEVLRAVIPRGRVVGIKLGKFNRERLARFKILRKALGFKKP